MFRDRFINNSCNYIKNFPSQSRICVPSVLHLQGSRSCSYGFNGDTGDNFNVLAKLMIFMLVVILKAISMS